MDVVDQRGAATQAWLAKAWAQEAVVREVEVEGAVVRYRGWGLEDTAKPGLVLVHGFMAHARWWDHIAPHFLDRYRVIAPDLTGMGDSDRRPIYSRRQFARELLAAADHAGLDQLTIISHSFGSLSGLYTARITPERITRAIVIDTYVFRAERYAVMETRPANVYPSREAAEARYRLGPPGLWPDPDVLAYVRHHSVMETAEGWTWKFDPFARDSIDSEKDLRSDLANLPIPVDFIYGDRSEVVDAEAVALMMANLPSCGQPIKIPLCHHHVMIEQPVALLAALGALLAHPRTDIA